MKIPKLQLGLTSEYGAFNGNIAYAEGSTAENPKSMIQFFGLPNNRTAEQLAEMPECAEAWAFARHVVTASNERDALCAKVAALVEAFQSLVYECRETTGALGYAERRDANLTGASHRFAAAVQKAEAAIAAAGGSAE